jgi:hypothetical protein
MRKQCRLPSRTRFFRNLMAFRTWRFDLSQCRAAVKRRYVKVGNDWISRADPQR